MKTKYLIAVVLLAMGFVSCEDALKEEAYGNPTTENLLKDPDNAALLVGQVYADIKWLHDHWGYWGVLTITSDECVVPIRRPNDWNDDGYWSNLNTMDWTSKDLSFEYVWNQSLRGATLCNQIIAQLEDAKSAIGDENFNRFKAELVVVRSYYYYTLFDAFGRVPYAESFKDDASTRELMSVTETWKHLVKDLEENAELLPLANNPSKAENYGRVTRGFAHGLLAKLYLNAESFGVEGASTANYDKCIAFCDSVINSGVYSVESNFFKNFAIKNESSEENMFVIVENGDASFDYRDVAGKMANKLRVVMLTLHYAHQQAWDLKEKPWNGFAATPEFIDLYGEVGDDKRGLCDGTTDDGHTPTGTKIDFTNDDNKRGWFVGPVYDPKNMTDTIKNVTDSTSVPVVIVNSFQNVAATSPNDGARCLKYEVERGTNSGDGNKFCDNDFVLMRYADILMMKLEAIQRGGAGSVGDVTGNADYQLIGTRSTGTALGDLSLDQILDERGREFAWELSRRRDLIRYGKYLSGKWTGKPAAKTEEFYKWFPIPFSVLETSPKWTQTSGYENN